MSRERNYLVTVGLVELRSGVLVASALCGVTFDGTQPLCEVAEAANLVQLSWRWPEDFLGGAEFTKDDEDGHGMGEAVPIDENSGRVYRHVVLGAERAPEEVVEGEKLEEGR